MNEFDLKAREWDNNQVRVERAVTVAAEIKKQIPTRPGMRALEFGSGTGLLSFELQDHFSGIVLMDNSREMIRVCEEKCAYHKTPHIQPVWFDLEKHDYDGKFDIIYSLMVLHHVTNVDMLLNKFTGMLNPGGILLISDLYTEDGSFHDSGEIAHKGFDPDELLNILKDKGYKSGRHTHCYNVKRSGGRKYPIFLLWAHKNDISLG